MTIINETSAYNKITTTGGETVLDYTFPIFDEDYIKVQYENSAGYKTDLVIGTDYTVSGVGQQSGGAINLVVGASVGKYYLIQDTPYQRVTDFQEAGDFFARDLNEELDLQEQQIQQLNREVSRSIRVDYGQDTTQFANEVNRIYNSIDNVDTCANDIANINTCASNITDIQNASANAATATTKASEASASATSASTSATNANNAMTSAQASATSAASSVNGFQTVVDTATSAFNTNATTKTNDFNTNATSATTAFNTNAQNKTNDFNTNATTKTTAFNTNATTKQALVDSAATSAQNSATSAANSVNGFQGVVDTATSAFNSNATTKTTAFNTNATTKTNDFNANATAKQALVDASATSAQNSANAAANSATNAATSETNAASSATSASTSETNAASSATSASTQAGIATTGANVSINNANSSQINAQTASTKANESAASATASEASKVQSANYAAISKKYAIGEPTEPTEGSAKYWAEVASQGQIQSDWNQADNTQKDYIKNKPTNLVTTDTVQTITGAKTFSNKSTMNAIELGKEQTTNGGYVNFHFAGDMNSDHTSRVIEDVSGQLNINGVKVSINSPTPPSTSNDTSVATTAWVKSNLTGKANTDMDNITATGKETVVGWGMPDYSAGVSASYPYTAPTKGYFMGYVQGPENSTTYYLYVNGSLVGGFKGRASRSEGDVSINIPLEAGDVLTCTYTFVGRCVFYPCKGV